MKKATILSGEYGMFRVSWGTHVGRVREGNEDALTVTEGPKGALLMAVADGLGGQASGEIASALAIHTLESGVKKSENPGPDLKLLVEAGHAAILDQADQDPSHTGMSTTCSALIIREDTYWIAHVGDSRIYGVDEKLHPLTRDHTWEASIKQSGDSSYMPAAARHVLTRCVGTRNAFSVDTSEASWKGTDKGFLLCTDGLHGQVPEALCYRLWQEEPEEAVRQMIQAALDSGGPDNISVIVAQRKG